MGASLDIQTSPHGRTTIMFMNYKFVTQTIAVNPGQHIPTYAILCGQAIQVGGPRRPYA